jgi:hypothetical protein
MAEPAPQIETYPRRSRFPLEDYDTVQPGHLSWRVKGVLPSVGVAFLGGPSMSGKSFVGLDWGDRICRGEPVLGCKSVQAGVIYIASEGAQGVRLRIQALRAERGPLGGMFKMIGVAPDLRDADQLLDLRAVLTEAKAEIEAASGHPLGVVVVDTFSASLPGADENAAGDLSAVLQALQEIALELQVLVLVVAHTGKDMARGLRGWSGQFANADAVVMLDEPSSDGLRSGVVTKVKDAVSGAAFAFRLRTVDLGTDSDGDPVTTCLVDPVDAPDRPKPGRKPLKVGSDADLLRTAFNRLFDHASVPVHAAGASGCRGLRLADLRAEAFRIGLGPTEPDYDGLDDGEQRKKRKAWADHRTKSFQRALTVLREAGGWRTEDDLIWEVRRPGSVLP